MMFICVRCRLVRAVEGKGGEAGGIVLNSSQNFGVKLLSYGELFLYIFKV